MFISRRRYEEALGRARGEVYRDVEADRRWQDCERRLDELAKELHKLRDQVTGGEPAKAEPAASCRLC
ncbi:MAG: hypothetical protein IK116_08940 [Firmicutes bacterium]|nr:hypothetical protein [Bacillota bacterium]